MPLKRQSSGLTISRCHISLRVFPPALLTSELRPSLQHVVPPERDSGLIGVSIQRFSLRDEQYEEIISRWKKAIRLEVCSGVHCGGARVRPSTHMVILDDRSIGSAPPEYGAEMRS